MTDHIFTEAKTGKFSCLSCGATESPPHMPASIDVIIGAMDHFISQHEGCPAEAVMSEYILGFDAGCDYIIREIELWQGEVGKDLLAHLRMESKQGRETT